MTQIATIVYALGILGLFLLDRDRKIGTSKALWIPVIWLLIVGSRPISAWLGISSSTMTASQMLEGSPLEALIFAILMVAGIIVLIHRGRRISVFLRANGVIVLYFSYCLLSVLWSDFPDVAFKRWTKAIGDLVMVLIVMTDVKPAAALTRFLARAGFILLPASVLLIKYFGDLGRGYDEFTGVPMNTGVTTNKNSLGLITFILSLGALWRVLTLLRGRGQPNRSRHLLAQGALLAFGVALLVMAHSATSWVSFALGSALMIATGLPVIGRHPAAVHALVVLTLITGGLSMLLGGDAAVVHALGRQTNLTGRTEIWDAVIPMAPNPVLGAGFESFWLGPRLERIWDAFPVFKPNEAHNGYIEVYLNLGLVGLSLIAMILVNGYTHATAVFRRDLSLGGLMLGYVAAAAIYSVTEAGFRMLNPIWIFLLLGASFPGDYRGARTKASQRRASEATTPNSSLIEENYVVARPKFFPDRSPRCAYSIGVAYPELPPVGEE